MSSGAKKHAVPLALLAAVIVAALAAIGPAEAKSSGRGQASGAADANLNRGAVYAMTNHAAGNQVVVYSRAPDGQLALKGYVDTGGLGTSRIRLSSQGPVVLSPDNRWLYVVNVGSDDLSVFRVVRDGLRLVQVVPSGGDMPNSVTVHGDLVYVLNNGGLGLGNISGFRQAPDGTLRQLPGSSRPLSAAGADPAQVIQPRRRHARRHGEGDESDRHLRRRRGRLRGHRGDACFGRDHAVRLRLHSQRRARRDRG